MSKDCEGCEWYRYPVLMDNSLKNKPIPIVIMDLRRCERGWCDKERRTDGRKAGRMNQKWCRGCPHLDFNEMSDEMYCKLKDYEQIRLRWHKHRPDWCPLVTGAEREEE